MQSFPSVAQNLTNEDKEHIYEMFKDDYHSIYAEKLGVSVPILLGAINAEFGHYDLAIKYLCKEKHPSSYIKAVVKELEMRALNICKEDRDKMLTLFFGSKYKTYIELNWRNCNIVGGLFDPFRLKKGKVQLTDCEVNNNISKLFVLLKENMKNNIVQQREIGNKLF